MKNSFLRTNRTNNASLARLFGELFFAIIRIS
nr:MAG TPA: hypothetical protein [Caudoviricetes sp.]